MEVGPLSSCENYFCEIRYMHILSATLSNGVLTHTKMSSEEARPPLPTIIPFSATNDSKVKVSPGSLYSHDEEPLLVNINGDLPLPQEGEADK